MPNTRNRSSSNETSRSSECLICLDTIRQPWHPGKPCDCKPALHKRCWDQWISHGNAVCIICRDQNNKELRIRQLQIIRYEYQPEPVNRCSRCMAHLLNSLLLFIVVYYLLYFMLDTMKTIQTLRFKDEL